MLHSLGVKNGDIGIATTIAVVRKLQTMVTLKIVFEAFVPFAVACSILYVSCRAVSTASIHRLNMLLLSFDLARGVLYSCKIPNAMTI